MTAVSCSMLLFKLTFYAQPSCFYVKNVLLGLKTVNTTFNGFPSFRSYLFIQMVFYLLVCLALFLFLFSFLFGFSFCCFVLFFVCFVFLFLFCFLFVLFWFGLVFCFFILLNSVFRF